MDEMNMTEGQKLGKSLYDSAMGVLTKENAQANLIVVISICRELILETPDRFQELCMLSSLAMNAIGQRVPANKMIYMLNPDNYEKMAEDYIKHSLASRTNKKGAPANEG